MRRNADPIHPVLLVPLVVACFGLSTRSAAGEEPNPGPLFIDATSKAAIDWVHVNGAKGEKILVESMCGGAGWIDYDNDGWLDLYLVNGHSEPRRAAEKGAEANRLYRNRGDKTFEDVTDRAGVGDRGYGFGLAAGDFDNDGDTDLYVTNYGANVLYRNEGDGTFRDVTEEAGVACPAWSTSAAFFDANGDGWLDLYVANYLDYDAKTAQACVGNSRKLPSYCHPNRFDGAPDALFINQRNGTFADISERAGITAAGRAAGKGLGVLPLDFDRDGDTDIFVANDSVPNFLWRNLGGGKFEDAAIEAGVALETSGKPEACMGIAAADLNADGWEDWFVTNFSQETDTLFLSEGDGFYEDATDRVGLATPTWLPLGFGTGFVDFDLDGDLDIFVTRGHVLDNVEVFEKNQTFAQTDQLFENTGDFRAPRFRDVSSRAGPYFSLRRVGRAAAFADYDNDGDVDVFVVLLADRPALLECQGADRERAHWLGVSLESEPPFADAFGSRVTIVTAPGERTYEVRSAGSYLAANDPRIVVGLGTSSEPIDEVRVRWSDGLEETFRALSPDRYHRLVRGQGSRDSRGDRRHR